jgi:hypothetical protein
VRSLAFVPAGRTLFSLSGAGDDGTVGLWAVADGKLTEQASFKADFASDGRHLFVAYGNKSINVLRLEP